MFHGINNIHFIFKDHNQLSSLESIFVCVFMNNGTMTPSAFVERSKLCNISYIACPYQPDPCTQEDLEALAPCAMQCN